MGYPVAPIPTTSFTVIGTFKGPLTVGGSSGTIGDGETVEGEGIAIDGVVVADGAGSGAGAGVGAGETETGVVAV